MSNVLEEGVPEEMNERYLQYIEMPQCESLTRSGERCKNNATKGINCHLHSNVESCSVCFASMNETNSRVLDCGHKFHTRCLDRWKRRSHTCPMCRTPFDQPRYRVRITIEPEGTNMEMITSNISNIVNMFGLDPNHLDNFFTDIRFADSNLELINELIREITAGSNLTSFNTVGTTEL